MRQQIPCALFAAACVCGTARAGITTYGNGQRDAWFEDVEDVGGAQIMTIGFNEFLHGTSITDQYRDDGVIFDGNNFTQGPSCGIYPQDCFGLQGLLNIAFEFDSPRNAIAADYPGTIEFLLYRDHQLVVDEFFITTGPGNFAGLRFNNAFRQRCYYTFNRVILRLLTISTLLLYQLQVE